MACGAQKGISFLVRFAHEMNGACAHQCPQLVQLFLALHAVRYPQCMLQVLPLLVSPARGDIEVSAILLARTEQTSWHQTLNQVP